MYINWLKLIILFCFVNVQPISSAWCRPGDEYMVQCNKCWCLENGVPICTRMICNERTEKASRRPNILRTQRIRLATMVAAVVTIANISVNTLTALCSWETWSSLKEFISSKFS